MQILIKNIKTLAGILAADKKMLKGAAMNELHQLNDAFLLIENNRIAAFGKNDDAPKDINHVIDANGRFVLPAWCDSHTHIVFAAYRESEFEDKIAGLSYEEIAKKGGGILNSAEKLNHTDENFLYEKALERLAAMRDFGTGAVEIKSGYGLSVAGELKMLRVIKRLKENTKQTIKATFLGAHAMPLAFRENRAAYIDLLTEKMLPVIADEGLADYIDVFCDRGFFTVDETDRILQAGAGYGLIPKIHANELDYSGGIEVGVKNRALSVDHLEFTGDAQIAALQQSHTMPTILPSTAFFLGLHYAPARQMIAAGLPIAMATDYNPGSSPSGNMPFIISLACIKMKLTPAEAINAVTINSAYAMGVENELGSITVGKKANLIITKPIENLSYIPYAFGSNHIERTILNGEIE